MKIPLKIRLKLIRKHWQLTWKFRFAHHPLCPRFENHIFKIGQLRVCQGCSLTYLGMLLGFLLFILSLNSYMASIWTLIYTAIGLLIPILLVEVLNIDYRPIKWSIRVMSGLGIGMIGAFIFKPLTALDRSIAILLLFVSYGLFRASRIKKENLDRCEGCPELNAKGVCTGFRLQEEAEREYSRYADSLLTPLIYKELEKKYPGTISAEKLNTTEEKEENQKREFKIIQ